MTVVRPPEHPSAAARESDPPSAWRRRGARYVLAGVLLLLATPAPGLARSLGGAQSPPLVGLDHIPVAVADLDAAVEQYRRLGFALKPGRSHANGIRNYHVKFPDGTEIELISAPEARDALTAEYRRHVAVGDGPAFVGFYARDLTALAAQLDAAGWAHHQEGGLLAFPESDALRYIFFGSRNASPTDRPEHFRHPNGAEALIGVWLAADDLGAERRLLMDLGGTEAERDRPVPGVERATVVGLPQAEVVLLPASRQLVSGRRIVGATVWARDLAALRRALTQASPSLPPLVETADGRSLLLPPDLTHGLWLEFRERR